MFLEWRAISCRIWLERRHYFSTGTAGAIGTVFNSVFPIERIRNFGIIAHVDHGKSTLADRLMQLTNVITKEDKHQYLDKLQDYMINLIDTPGHIDFSYEVSRSLVACDGVLLLIAANQGIQAQTIANFWLAFNRDRCIIPVINKIDMVGEEATARVESQIVSLFGFQHADILRVSAKTGANVPAILDAIVERIPPPQADRDASFTALVFDSWFDEFRGGIALVLVQRGAVSSGARIRALNTARDYDVVEVGVMHPEMRNCEALHAGQVGYLICNMKTVKEATIGEVLYDASSSVVVPSAANATAFKPTRPAIYAGLFPVDASEYESLRKAVERLCLNDASVTLEASASPALGAGWRVGFLGALHMEVFGQRLDQEYDANVILTAPTVEYRAVLVDNATIRRKRHGGRAEIRIGNAAQFPQYPTDVAAFHEPMALLTIVAPDAHVDAVSALCARIRGEQRECVSIDESRLMLKWRVPLAEVIGGFFEDLKRETSGYASFDYEDDGYREIELVKIAIRINQKLVEEFSHICPKGCANTKAREIVDKLKEKIPRQQYEVNIGAYFGTSTRPFYHSTIKAYRKDFTGTLKGNMVSSRLQKKLRDQQRGKERMKLIGQVKIPKEAFLEVVRK